MCWPVIGAYSALSSDRLQIGLWAWHRGSSCEDYTSPQSAPYFCRLALHLRTSLSSIVRKHGRRRLPRSIAAPMSPAPMPIIAMAQSTQSTPLAHPAPRSRAVGLRPAPPLPTLPLPAVLAKGLLPRRHTALPIWPRVRSRHGQQRPGARILAHLPAERSRNCRTHCFSTTPAARHKLRP